MIFSSICTRLYEKRRLTAKTLLAMKLSAIILLSACLQVSAKGYAQRVTLSEKNASLETVFRYIEKQTGYVFFFDQHLLDKAKKVSVDLKRASLEKALQACFA